MRCGSRGRQRPALTCTPPPPRARQQGAGLLGGLQHRHQAGPARAGRLPWGHRADILAPAEDKARRRWPPPRSRGCHTALSDTPRQGDFKRPRLQPGASRAQAHRAARAAGERGGGENGKGGREAPPRSCASALTPAAWAGGQARRAPSPRRGGSAAAGRPPRGAGAARARTGAGRGPSAAPAHCSSHKPWQTGSRLGMGRPPPRPWRVTGRPGGQCERRQRRGAANERARPGVGGSSGLAGRAGGRRCRPGPLSRCKPHLSAFPHRQSK